MPAEVSKLVQAGRAGDVETALKQHDRLAPLFRALFLEPNPQPVKAALEMTGQIPSADVRLPLVRCSDPVLREVDGAFERLA